MYGDTLQPLRMALAWPLVVAAFTWWLVFLVLEWRRPGHPQNALLALVTAATAAITASGISQLWDNGPAYWWAFTMGLFGAAAVLWSSIGYVAMRHVRAK